ncbi:MAG: hypothetical protein ABI282_03515 [Candidatus Baltobacteraceae bacterium]
MRFTIDFARLPPQRGGQSSRCSFCLRVVSVLTIEFATGAPDTVVGSDTRESMIALALSANSTKKPDPVSGVKRARMFARPFAV